MTDKLIDTIQFNCNDNLRKAINLVFILEGNMELDTSIHSGIIGILEMNPALAKDEDKESEFLK